jgi:hypothetical protein
MPFFAVGVSKTESTVGCFYIEADSLKAAKKIAEKNDTDIPYELFGNLDHRFEEIEGIEYSVNVHTVEECSDEKVDSDRLLS